MPRGSRSNAECKLAPVTRLRVAHREVRDVEEPDLVAGASSRGRAVLPRRVCESAMRVGVPIGCGEVAAGASQDEKARQDVKHEWHGMRRPVIAKGYEIS